MLSFLKVPHGVKQKLTSEIIANLLTSERLTAYLNTVSFHNLTIYHVLHFFCHVLPFPHLFPRFPLVWSSAPLPSPVFIIISCTHSPITLNSVSSPGCRSLIVRSSPSHMLSNQVCRCYRHCSCQVLSSFKSSYFFSLS